MNDDYDLDEVFLVIDSRTNDVIAVFADEEDAKGRATFDLYWTVVSKDLE